MKKAILAVCVFIPYLMVAQDVIVVSSSVPPGAPSGNRSDAQCEIDGSLSNCSGLLYNVQGDLHDKRPNPWIDTSLYGARAMIPRLAPVTTGVTATISLSNPTTAKISTNSCPGQVGGVCIVNGDGVVVYGAGAACALSTPAAPTVMVSNDGGVTGSGFVVNARFTGSTAYQYQVVAVDKNGCVSAASPVTSISNGNSLGLQTVNVSTCTRSNGIATCATSSAHTLGPGAAVFVIGTSDDMNFAGWQMVDTVPDSTHFTYTNGIDLSNGNNILTPLTTQGIGGNGISATGGTARWFNLNRITVTAVANAWEYCFYGRTSRSNVWLGCGKPQGDGISSTITDLTFDDYGSPLNDNRLIPAWIPRTPPGAAQARWLTANVRNVSGTTLTLDTAATTAVSGAVIRHDNCPPIQKAVTAAGTGRGGYFNYLLHFPVSGVGQFYDINSTCTLPPKTAADFTQGLWLNGTLVVQTSSLFIGNMIPQAHSVVGFAQNSGPNSYVNEAYPGIYGGQYSYTFRQLAFIGAPSNGAIPMIFDQVQPFTLEDTTLIGGSDGTNGGLDMALILRGNGASTGGGVSSSYVIQIRNSYMSAGGNSFNQSFNNVTPAFFCNGCGILEIDNLQLNQRGVAIASSTSGAVNLKWIGGRIQGGANPVIATIGNVNGTYIDWEHYEIDTYHVPPIANLAGSAVAGGQATGSLYINEAACTAANEPMLSGRPFQQITVANNYQANCAVSGQNHDIVLTTVPDTLYPFTPFSVSNRQHSSTRIYNWMHFPGNNRLYWDHSQIAAPTTTLSAGGSTAIATYTFYVAPIGFDGGVGALSFPSNTCVTAKGNQTCTVTWTPVPGASSYQVFMSSNGGGACAVGKFIAGGGPYTLTISSGPNFSACAAKDSASGPTYMGRNEIGSRQFRMTDNTTGFSLLLQEDQTVGMTASRTATFPDVSGYVPVSGYQNSVMDNFNRANGAVGSNWRVNTGGANVSSNTVVGTASTANVIWWSANQFSSVGQYSQVILPTGPGAGFPGASVMVQSSGDSAYVCFESSTTLTLQKRSRGSGTTLASTSVVTGSGDLLRIEITAVGNLTCTQNGTTSVTATDTTFTSGAPGLLVWGTAIPMDNWSGGNSHPINQLDTEQDYTKTQHLRQNGGSCAMSSATTCTITLNTQLPASDSNRCIATVQGSSAIAGACAISGSTITITAASPNSATWTAFVF